MFVSAEQYYCVAGDIFPANVARMGRSLLWRCMKGFCIPATPDQEKIFRVGFGKTDQERKRVARVHILAFFRDARVSSQVL